METDYTVDESEGVQHVCVELTGVLDTSISVTVDTQPNTALGMHSELSRFHCICSYSSSLMFNRTLANLCNIDNEQH